MGLNRKLTPNEKRLRAESRQNQPKSFVFIVQKRRPSPFLVVKCAHPICREQIKGGYFSCEKHWRVLPSGLRRAFVSDNERVHFPAKAEIRNWWALNVYASKEPPTKKKPKPKKLPRKLKRDCPRHSFWELIQASKAGSRSSRENPAYWNLPCQCPRTKPQAGRKSKAGS